MIAQKQISVRLKGIAHNIRPGKPIPAAVLAFWTKSGDLETMIAEGNIAEGAPDEGDSGRVYGASKRYGGTRRYGAKAKGINT